MEAGSSAVIQRVVSTLGLHNVDLTHPAGVSVQGPGTDKGSPNTFFLEREQ